ncbi:MAG: hypothetical protein ACYTGX_18985 [Planctomycetota bacterium]|jgi:hypothetical protein
MPTLFRAVWTVLLVPLAGLLAGCMPYATFSHPANAVVLTEGAEIAAADASWKLSGGELVPAPFTTELIVEVRGQELWEAGEHFHHLQVPEWAVSILDGGPAEAVDFGAQQVRVTYPGREKPLYGILALCPVADATSDSAVKRAYRIEIPPERVEQATAGRVSVVYRPYKGHPHFPFNDMVAWILWLSDVPLEPGTPVWKKELARHQRTKKSMSAGDE